MPSRSRRCSIGNRTEAKAFARSFQHPDLYERLEAIMSYARARKYYPQFILERKHAKHSRSGSADMARRALR